MKNTENLASPSQQDRTEPAPRVGFKFIDTYGDEMGTRKYIDYKPAKIYRGAKKWHVEFYFRNPETKKFERYKVYEDINRLKGEDKENFAQLLKKAVDYGLSKGFNPFAETEIKVVVKNWTVVQGLNYFKQNLPNRGLRKRTQQTYGSVLMFLYEYLPLQTPIKELSKIQVNSIFNQVRQKKAWTNVTFNNYITLTKAIWNYLIEHDITDNNPIKVKPLPEEIKRHKYFSEEVFNKIKKDADPDHLDYMLFIYHTGARPEEIDKLTDENFLWDENLIYIPSKTSKVAKGRYIPMSDYIQKKYKNLKGRVFRYSKNYYIRKFSELRKKLKLDKDYTNYAMKHTKAAHLAQDNVNIYVIMQFLGHSNPRTTMKYIRDLGININREAVEKGIRF